MQKTVRVVSTEVTKAGKTDRVVLHHTNLDGSSYKPGTPDKIGNLAVKLDDVSRSTVLGAKAGDVLDIELTKDGNFWNLIKATASSGATPAPTFTQAAKKPAFDDVGVKVGAAANRAVQVLAATKGAKFTLDDVDAMTYEILVRQQRVEDNTRAGVNPVVNTATSDNDAKAFEDDDFFGTSSSQLQE